MAVPLDPTSSGFLFAENRNQPMHVGGLMLISSVVTQALPLTEKAS